MITDHEKIYIKYLDTGAQVKELRKSLHLTQQEFADIFEVEKLTVARWESGKRAFKGPAKVLINLIIKLNLWDRFIQK